MAEPRDRLAEFDALLDSALEAAYAGNMGRARAALVEAKKRLSEQIEAGPVARAELRAGLRPVPVPRVLSRG